MKEEQEKIPITLEGIVERVTFHNKDNGFCVLRIKIKGQRETLTVIGNIAAIANGETISVTGKWNNDKKFGLQLCATSINVILPATIDGLRKYLGSGLIKGIGPCFASKIVDYFGLATIDVIEVAPNRLIEVDGIGKGRAELIARSWADSRAIRDIMIFLQSHNVGMAVANKIFKHYGNEALEVVKNNPYQLARDIKGIGFISADKIAMNLGISPHSPQRAEAALSYILYEASSSGHCALPEKDLLDKAEKELKVDRVILEQALKDEIKTRRLVPVITQNIINDICTKEKITPTQEVENNVEKLIFLPIYLHYESFTAQKILEINRKNTTFWSGLDIESGIIWLKEECNISLSESQNNGLKNVLSNKISVITGGPGTGKTTLVNSVIKILTSYREIINIENNTNIHHNKIRIKLAAPTGRAAKRLSESTHHYAETIHRLLEYDHQNGGFKHDTERPLPCDLLIIDESSMLDVHLMYSLLKAITVNTSIILVGDIDQIPSIGAGQILKDIIQSCTVSVTRLDKIFRQAINSQIIVNAHLINRGIIPKLEDHSNYKNLYYNSERNLESTIQSTNKFDITQDDNKRSATIKDFLFYEVRDPQDALNAILQILTNDLPKLISNKQIKKKHKQNDMYQNFDIKRDVQILCPMQKGGLGAKAMNIELQKVLNPSFCEDYIEILGRRYGVNDKVMQIENNYDKSIFNGDIGYIVSINREDSTLHVDFDGYHVEYEFDELDQLVLAYAITIHKSQGSEYPIIIIPILIQHFVMLNKNLLYTAITRGKNLVILVGQKKAIAIAVKNNSANKRYTKLRDLLAAINQNDINRVSAQS